MGRGFSQRSQRSTPMRPANSQRGGTTTTTATNNNNNVFSAPPPPFPYAPSASLHPRDVSVVSAVSGGATPLVAELSTEGMMNMNMNSPSALLALGIGGGGTSSGGAAAPAATSGGGGGNASAAAGILHDNDLPSLSVAPIPDVSVAGTATVRGGTVGPGGGSGAVDAAEERGRRLNEVLAMLRSRITGRGVSREGIVQLSKLEGLECMWQGDNLTGAGSSIDLEIEFESGGSDYVRDVTLSYAVPATGDIVTREDGAEVMKRNMMLSDEEKREYKWKRLDNFHENIQRLARLDQLSKQVSCFQAIEGLHNSLKEIWNAEEVRGGHKGYYDHVSTNAIGGPNMDKGKRIGLVLDYWVPQRRILDRRRAAENNKMDIDIGNAGEKKQPPPLEPAANPWSAEIDCEEGFPSLRVSSQWVSPDIYSSPPPKDDQQQQQTTPQPTISWLEPPPTTITPDQPQPQPTTTTAAATAPTPAPIPIDRRFVARLTPPIHLPVRIASDIFRTLQIPIPPDLRSSIYDHLVVPPERDAPPTTTPTPARKGGKAGTTAAGNVEPTVGGSERKVPRGKPFQKTGRQPVATGVDIVGTTTFNGRGDGR
ncbi:hypothetical protein KEM56_003853 [Ascosphaera pollenicola]|nr:hypothetical protein KEM56_003853 [Ascosphaera pollenicola]